MVFVYVHMYESEYHFFLYAYDFKYCIVAAALPIFKPLLQESIWCCRRGILNGKNNTLKILYLDLPCHKL